MMRAASPLFLSCLLIVACAEKKQFSGSGNGTSETSSINAEPKGPAKTADVSVDNSNAGLSACVEGDKIVIPWKGAAKACFDQGKTFDFDRQVCVELRKASFSCDWETVKAKLAEKTLLTETLKNDAAQGAKLVSCGQSADGNRIAVQWVKIAQNPGVSCNTIEEGAGITTGCYTYFADRNPPPPAQSQDELRQRVAECLRNL